MLDYENFTIIGKQIMTLFAMLYKRCAEHIADKIFSFSLIRSSPTEWNLPKFMLPYLQNIQREDPSLVFG